MTRNITPHEGKIELSDRERLLGQKAVVLWMTGLSGSGKSTIAFEIERKLYQMGHLSYVLDGDNLRDGLNSDLEFSPEDRAENQRRVAEVARLMADAGIIVIASLISPDEQTRQRAAATVGEDRFHLVWVATPLEICEDRDPKGLYAKARRGEIPHFTGISAPYEEPSSADLVLHPEEEIVAETVNRVVEYLTGVGALAGG